MFILLFPLLPFHRSFILWLTHFFVCMRVDIKEGFTRGRLFI